MKIKIFLVFVFTILLSRENKAQSNFVEGYILTSETDTIYGKIDNKDYYSNSQYCDFKGTYSDSITRFYPGKIYGYRFINDKFYVSRNIEIEGKKSVVFMEYLIKGKLDIYFYQDKDYTNHYYAAKDTMPLQELKYSEDIKEIDGKKMLYKSKQYIGLLRYYTYDCPSIKNKIPELGKPTHKNLIDLAQNYHNLTCTNEKCIVYEKNLPNKIKFNINGGALLPFTSLYNTPSNKIYPSVGFDVLFQQAQRNERSYYGLGIYKVGVDLYLIPLSFYYLNPKMGVSPVLAYELELNSFATIQIAKFGIKYQMKKVAFSFTGNLMTNLVVIPIGSSLNFGIIYDLR